MVTIDLGTMKGLFTYDKARKTFSISEKYVRFDSSYKLISPSKNEKVFDFSGSTGPEFDPNTKWIYKCDDMILEVCNDKAMTEHYKKNYIAAKARH